MTSFTVAWRAAWGALGDT